MTTSHDLAVLEAVAELGGREVGVDVLRQAVADRERLERHLAALEDEGLLVVARSGPTGPFVTITDAGRDVVEPRNSA